MEKLLYNTFRFTIVITFIIGLPLVIHKKYDNKYLVIIALLCFSISVFSIGLWAVLGTIYRWKTFTKSYKRIDFEKYLGGIGSLIYIFIGVGAISVSLFFLYLVLYKIQLS
jgi:hypothetical protein